MTDLSTLSNYALVKRLPEGPLADELLRRMDQRNTFMRIAAALGQMHAANLHEAELSTCSKSRRERFKSIMEKTARMLKLTEEPRRPLIATTPEAEVAEAVERLEDHAARIPLK